MKCFDSIIDAQKQDNVHLLNSILNPPPLKRRFMLVSLSW